MPPILKLIPGVTFLALLACSKPSTTPPLSPSAPREISSSASRLQFNPRTFIPSLGFFRESPTGILEVSILINSDGKVQKAHMLAGSSPMWFHLRKSIEAIRFFPSDKTDIGPWEAILVFTSTSNGSGGGAFEAMHTGSSSSSSTINFYIAEVALPPK